MLEEIVCLGSNVPDDRTNEYHVMGIILHIERSGENAAYNLVFKRENSSVVQIGRRSGQDSDKCHDGTSAMFRCAVVSRKHAKIVFSDGGHAYIIDSGSHHGTHIRKVGDSFPRMLKPETSTLLNDGDTITFGKAVGKGDEWVKPVVAHVQLQCASTPFKALTVPSPPSSEKSSLSSGRYGIHDSTSSEDSYSNSSDTEEVQSSPTNAISGPQGQDGTTDVTTEPKPLDQSHDLVQVTAAYNTFKRFIPTFKRLPSVSEIIGTKGGGLFDVTGDSFPTLPTLPATIRGRDDTGSYIFDAKLSEINELRQDSRSNSPMVLGSPSPLADVQPRQLSTPLLTPVIDSLGTSLLPLFDLPPVISSQNTSSNSGVSEPIPLSPRVALHDAGLTNEVTILSAPTPPLHSALHGTTDNVSTSSEIAEIQQTLKQLAVSVNKLHASRRKYKSRFNANVSFMSNKLSEIDDKFAEVDAEYNVLCDQVEEAHHGDLPDLARQIEELSERVDNARFKAPEVQSPPPMPTEDIKVSIKSLNDLADEMRAFHLKSQEELSMYRDDMKAIREEATKTIEQTKAIVVSVASGTATAGWAGEIQTPVPTSLKRKRDDMDENEDVAVGQADNVQAVSTGDPISKRIANEETDVTMIDLATQMNQADDFAKRMDLVELPPRKKIRTIGSVFAHTATAVTIGAVITWSALAFS